MNKKLNFVMPEYEYMIGVCRECIHYDAQNKKCKKYANMTTEPDQTCKSWDDGNVEKKQIQQSKNQGWKIGF